MTMPQQVETPERAPKVRARGGKVMVPDAQGRYAEEYSAKDKRQALEQVLDGMAEGHTVAETARRLGLRPGTVRVWMAQDEAVFARYQRMKDLLGRALAEEALETARATTGATHQADRLKVDTLRWLASKVNATEFGDRQVVEHQGAQTLKVKVVEEERPVRNAQAMAQGMAVLSAGVSHLTPLGKSSE